MNEDHHENAHETLRWRTPKKRTKAIGRRTKSMEIDCESSAVLCRTLLSPKAKAFIGITESENVKETVSEPSMGFKFAMGSSGNESRTVSKSNSETNRGFLWFKQWIPLH